MEKYKGIKFEYLSINDRYNYNNEIIALNKIACYFSKLGLTPIHDLGAYGNFSCRAEDGFIISKSCYTPVEPFEETNYVKVFLKKEHNQFITEGTSKPSSETPLHHAIFLKDDKISCIIHGHFDMFEDCKLMKITDSFYDYGTEELVDSALRIINKTNDIIYLKNHGFVCFGDNLESVTTLILEKYRVLNLI